MKYDCTKALDLIHEYRRLCDSHSGECGNCPFYDMSSCNLDFFDGDKIVSLQKWSDEHPEIPKLTREEYDFLQAFRVTADKHIERKIGHLFLVIGYTSMELWASMFPFIEEGQNASFIDMLRMEVEDE